MGPAERAMALIRAGIAAADPGAAVTRGMGAALANPPGPGGRWQIIALGKAARAMAEYDAVMPTLGDRFSAGAFRPGLRCRLLANFGAGYNHIDVEAAAHAGIAVTNTPDAVTEATADIALTLILMTARRAGEGGVVAGEQRRGSGAGKAHLIGRGVGPGFVHRDTQATGGGGGWGDGGLDPLAGGGVEAQHAN